MQFLATILLKMNFFVGIFHVNFDYKFHQETFRTATFKNTFFPEHIRRLLPKVLWAIYIFQSLLVVIALYVSF